MLGRAQKLVFGMPVVKRPQPGSAAHALVLAEVAVAARSFCLPLPEGVSFPGARR